MGRAGSNGVILHFLGKYSWATGATLEDDPAEGHELDLMIVGPFQLSLFCDSVIILSGLHEAEELRVVNNKERT